jgi:hypothetical protein
MSAVKRQTVANLSIGAIRLQTVAYLSMSAVKRWLKLRFVQPIFKLALNQAFFAQHRAASPPGASLTTNAFSQTSRVPVQRQPTRRPRADTVL